jgi:hypothetical protein
MIRELIQETKVTDDYNVLRKKLATQFNIVDYLKLMEDVYSPFGNNLPYLTTTLLKRLKIAESAVISKSAYVKHFVWRDENGYGNYGTPRREYKERYETLIEDRNFEELIDVNYEALGEEKFLSKVKKIVEKKVGKDDLAILILKKCVDQHSNPYDRRLSFAKFATERLEKLWANESEIFTLFERESLRKDSNRGLLNWIKSIKLNTSI